MGPAGEPHGSFVFEDQPSGGFEVGVGLSLVGEDGQGPAVLAGVDYFLIPIRAFDEANSEGLSSLKAPVEQFAQILECVVQVGLDGDARVGIALELRVFEYGPVDGEREVLEFAMLHIEVQERFLFDCLAKDRRKTRLGRGNGVPVRDRPQLRVERRRFDGDVDRGRNAPIESVVAERLPVFAVLLESLQRLKVSLGVVVGFEFRHRPPRPTARP